MINTFTCNSSFLHLLLSKISKLSYVVIAYFFQCTFTVNRSCRYCAASLCLQKSSLRFERCCLKQIIGECLINGCR